jgi:hypothetical protein
MDRGIVHKDLFGLLAFELGKPRDALRTQLAGDPTQVFAVADQLERAGFAELGLTLAEPVLDGLNGAPLLAANVTLSPKYLKSLLARQLQSEGVCFGPICLVPSEATLCHYREHLVRSLTSLVEKVRSANDTDLRILHGLIATSPELRDIETCFGHAVETLLASPAFLPVLIEALSAGGSEAVLGGGINAAFVAMAIFASWGGPSDPEVRRRRLVHLGMAALLQDLSLLGASNADADTHVVRSSELAQQLGAAPEVAELIRMHHAVTDEEGRPAQENPDYLAPAEKVLVTANVFLEMVGKEAKGRSFETMKELNYLAENRYLDPEAVRVLCRMFLPRVKAYIIEKAGKIADTCPSRRTRPILWPITGDKVPVVFLCQNEGCPHRTDQVSHVAQALPFWFGGREVATVAKGDYFTCPPLTAHLKRLYEVIESHIKGKG